MGNQNQNNQSNNPDYNNNNNSPPPNNVNSQNENQNVINERNDNQINNNASENDNQNKINEETNSGEENKTNENPQNNSDAPPNSENSDCPVPANLSQYEKHFSFNGLMSKIKETAKKAASPEQTDGAASAAGTRNRDLLPQTYAGSCSYDKAGRYPGGGSRLQRAYSRRYG